MYLVIDMRELRLVFVCSDVIHAEKLRIENPTEPWAIACVLEENEWTGEWDEQKLWDKLHVGDES
jgi:hypothetical protein